MSTDRRVNQPLRAQQAASGLWPPRITLSYNHHTPNSRPNSCNIHTHNGPA